MSEPERQGDDEAPRTVRVPIRRGPSVFDSDEFAEIDVEAAGQWDARQWREDPLC